MEYAKKTKTRQNGLNIKALLLTLVFMFSMPIMAFAATLQASQTEIDSFSPTHEFSFTNSSGDTVNWYLKVYTGEEVAFDSALGALVNPNSASNPSFDLLLQDGTTESSIHTKNLPSGYTNPSTVTTYTAPADTTSPTEVSSLTYTTTDTSIDLSYTLPTDTDFSHLNIYVDGVKDNSTNVTTNSYQVSTLTASTSYSIKITSVDTNGNESTGLTQTISTAASGSTGSGSGSTSDSSIFPSLTSTDIISEATDWTKEFDSMLLTIIGLGVGFAVVRFVKGLFF